MIKITKKLQNEILETIDLIRKLTFIKPSNPADMLALSLSQKSLKLITKLTSVQEILIITEIQKNNKEYEIEIKERYNLSLENLKEIKEEIKEFEIEYKSKIDERDKLLYSKIGVKDEL